MREDLTRRSYSRHASARPTRLKPWGQTRWIRLSMTDWSAAGVSLAGPTDKVPLGPATLEVPDRQGKDDIRLACEVVWRTDGKLGLRLRGPVHH